MAFWLLAGLVLLASSGGERVAGRPADCPARCGDVEIPYPFGIGAGCFRSEGFEIACSSTNAASGGLQVPTLTATRQPIQVQSLTVDPLPEVKVVLPVAYTCYNSSNNITGEFFGEVDLNSKGVYRISDRRNMFVVLGCNTVSWTQNGASEGKGLYDGLYYTGCITYCVDSQSAQDGKCAGIGCCHVDIPPGLTDNAVTLETWWERGPQVGFSPCDYAFLVDKDLYRFTRADLKMDRNRGMPVWLDWAIRDAIINNTSSSSSVDVSTASSCPPVPASATELPAGYACVSANSECVNSTNGPGYYCRCSKGYEGNPYDDHPDKGCKDIDECALPRETYPCYGVCTNTQGDYDCSCRAGYQASDAGPKKQECTPKFSFAARLTLGISLGFSFLAVVVLFTLMLLQKRQMNKYFRKNGGSILQKVDNIMIFSKDELKKITKNNSEVLGQGSFGKVYKGSLKDDTLVAVKTSIDVNEAQKDNFINEVIIQSQMIHNNIIKLLGCCLEVDVPVLVYEFAANGSLKEILHGDSNHLVHLTLDTRLDIAIDSAEGLRYMHSFTSHAIRHGDVKPANILLTDKFIAKISDFGTSKLLTVDNNFTLVVAGSMGYIDPVFYMSGHLTKKSDVYSFGVVLLELISRKPAIYGKNYSLVKEFRKAYDEANSGRELFDQEIAIHEGDVFILEEIGKLAMECLNEKVEERPDMTEVAGQLVMLRRLRKCGQENSSLSPRHFDEISIERTPRSFCACISEDSSATYSKNCPTGKSTTGREEML